MLRFPWAPLLALVATALAAGACSLLNAPVDVIPGAGGASTTASGTSSSTSTTTTGTGGTATTTGTGGAGGSPCTTAADCRASTEPCMQAACTAGACVLVPLPDTTPCDDGDPCDQPGACEGGSCTRGADACLLLATDCVTATCTSTGCATTNNLDGTFCGQTFCSNGLCASGHCSIVAVNEGQPCDDGLFCTVDDTCVMGHCVGTPNPCPTGNQCIQGTCDESAMQCFSSPIAEGAPCDDGDPCTAGEFCSGQACTGGIAPSVYFTETFATGGPGWTLGQEWQIGMAMQSFGGVDGNDPGFDYTGEGMLAGVDIGGLVHLPPYPQDPSHPLYYLTSPVVSTNFGGSVYLTFYRWLNSDYQPYMQDTIEVSSDGGTTWTVVWENPTGIPINDDAWTFESIDVTAYKGPTTRVRWGFAIGELGVYDEAGWNIDYVKLQNAPCPM
jgi:hypothetical protein